jgi:hypothetical protein
MVVNHCRAKAAAKGAFERFFMPIRNKTDPA